MCLFVMKEMVGPIQYNCVKFKFTLVLCGNYRPTPLILRGALRPATGRIKSGMMMSSLALTFLFQFDVLKRSNIL